MASPKDKPAKTKEWRILNKAELLEKVKRLKKYLRQLEEFIGGMEDEEKHGD